MSLTFSGPGGSAERRWIVYALLRDNVQHHLEGGESSGKFPQLDKISDALGAKSARVSAKGLAEELSRARQIVERPIEDLALSSRTVAVVSHFWPPPTDKKTRLASEHQVTIPFVMGAETLGDVFGSFIDELIVVATGGKDDAEVEVIDG